MPNRSLSYVRFLNCLDTLDRINPGRKLDFIEEQLLNKVMLSWDRNETILVGDLLTRNDLGSQATLHGRIKNLHVMGYIKLSIDKTDARKKHISPTKLALNRYEKLSDQMARVFQETQ
jgi:DNA-binding MarR family transcriptional regulator